MRYNLFDAGIHIMKKYLLVIVIILLVAGGYYIFIKNVDKGASNEVVKISTQIEAIGGQMIDVREPDEYAAGHADGAINVPLGDILNGDFSKIDMNMPVQVYCNTGYRAGQAKTALEKAGYKNVTNLGGLSDWIAKDGSTCSSTKPSC